MAKRSVKMISQAEAFPEPACELTQEEIEALKRRAEEERRARLAPYRAMHEQQIEQDELIADLMFRETMRELEE